MDSFTENTQIYQAFDRILSFCSSDELTKRIAQIELDLKNKDINFVKNAINSNDMDTTTLQAAFKVKHVAGQINVIIHTLGILNSLPYILSPNEKIEYLSLGAGNTGKNFDLETDKQVAEFKFINWTGADTIRQNNTFIDFFNLVEHKTSKNKYLYILDKKYVIKFFNNSRALQSVLSKNKKAYEKFSELYGNKYERVSEYYYDKKSLVEIVDLLEIIPNLSKYNGF